MNTRASLSAVAIVPTLEPTDDGLEVRLTWNHFGQTGEIIGYLTPAQARFLARDLLAVSGQARS